MGGDAKASAATKAAATVAFNESPGRTYFYLTALILAYFAKYFCTSFLYVVQNLWMKDQQISKQDLAHQFILGYCMSMIGKRAAGKWCDAWGGKNVQMLSLGVYIPVVIIWSQGDKISDALGMSSNRWPVYLTMWLCNGFFALGLSWVAIMVCASNWIPPHMEGRLLAVVGCAPELGDSSARAFLGPIIKHGWSGMMVMGMGAAGDWRTVSLSAALASIVLSAPMFLFVPESPLGYEEEKTLEKKKSGGEVSLDATLMTLTCTMCGLLYAIRTMFLLYSVNWLSEVYCVYYHANTDFAECGHDPVTVGNVATASLLFTFFGMFSVLLSGYCKDLCTGDKKPLRGWILFVNSVLLLLTVAIMLAFDTSLSFPMAAFLVGMIGFGDFGPYKTMSGAFAVDIGGKNRKGDVSAWMGVASNGSAAIILCIAGYIPAWSEMFKILMVLAVGCIVCSLLIVQYDKKKFAEAETANAASAREKSEPFLAA